MNQMNHQIMYSRATVVQFVQFEINQWQRNNFCQLTSLALARLAKSKTNAGSPDTGVQCRTYMHVYIYVYMRYREEEEDAALACESAISFLNCCS